MANIQSVMGRHRWMEGFIHDKLRNERQASLKCTNCAKTINLTITGESRVPVTGCPFDSDLRKLGTSQQQDQLERDMRTKLYANTEH